jgi:hypothetical protein
MLKEGLPQFLVHPQDFILVCLGAGEGGKRNSQQNQRSKWSAHLVVVSEGTLMDKRAQALAHPLSPALYFASW